MIAAKEACRYLSAVQVARIYEKATGTTARWMLKGCHGVKLRSVMVGGTRCTTPEWLDEFFAAVTAAREGQPVPSMEHGRDRASEAAERELEAAGW